MISADERFGSSADPPSVASDDGYDDLAIGSTNAFAGGTYRGAVSVWFGGGL